MGKTCSYFVKCPLVKFMYVRKQQIVLNLHLLSWSAHWRQWKGMTLLTRYNIVQCKISVHICVCCSTIIHVFDVFSVDLNTSCALCVSVDVAVGGRQQFFWSQQQETEWRLWDEFSGNNTRQQQLETAGKTQSSQQREVLRRMDHIVMSPVRYSHCSLAIVLYKSL